MTPPTVWLRPRKALQTLQRHPWVFVRDVGRIDGMPSPGAAVRLVTHEGEFIAWGLFNPTSAIRVRLYSWHEKQTLTDEFWAEQVTRSVTSRTRLFGNRPEWMACRMVSSEGDGLSGLTVDRYDGFLLLQWTSLALMQQAPVLVDTLEKLLQPRGVWQRTDTAVSEKEGFPPIDGFVAGQTPPEDLSVVEHGIRFCVDIKNGQKTGFYFDQRDNRLAVSKLCTNRRVLDVCTYSGGFALTALVHGQADHVTAVDGSALAIELATRNAEINGQSERITLVKSDAWKYLEQAHDRGARYDVIILDPPKLAKSRNSVDSALRGYHGLNTLALKLLNPNGVLATCSCSGLVSRNEFENVLAEAALSSDRPLRIIETRGAASDHPISIHCPESEYLKCIIGLT